MPPLPTARLWHSCSPIEHIEQLEGSVRLHVRFGDELKKIDQKWLLQAGLKKAGPRF